MTLIAGALYRGAMFQVVDRLLTNPDQAPFDPDTNKSLVVSLTGTTLFLGYSGSAYLRLRSPSGTTTYMPTDSWLAAVCSGRRLHNAAALDGTPDLDDLSEMDIVQRVGANIVAYRNTLRPAERRAFGLAVQIVGINHRHLDRPRAFGHLIFTDDGAPDGVRHVMKPRHHGWWAIGPGGRRPHPIVAITPAFRSQQVMEPALYEPAALDTLDTFREALVTFVRSMATENPTIGNDVLVLEYQPVRRPSDVDVRYLGSTARRMEGHGLQARPSRTPWYLSRYGASPPRAITGMRLSIGHSELGEDPLGLNTRSQGEDGLPLLMMTQTLHRKPWR